MSRITKALIDLVVEKALLKAGVVFAENALKEDRYLWAERLRIDAAGGADGEKALRQTIKKIRDLRGAMPSGFDHGGRVIREISTIRVNLAGMRVNAELKNNMPAPYEYVVLASNPLAQEFHDLEGRASDIKDRRATISGQVRATVSQFATIKRLVEAWPEVVELLPPAQIGSSKNLPVVQVADLNALVGLPSGDD